MPRPSANPKTYPADADYHFCLVPKQKWWDNI